jgi:hypothetical protein
MRAGQSIIQKSMARTATIPKSPQRLAAKRAAELAEVLQAFAESLRTLDASVKLTSAQPTPRNWWRLQAGRFKEDPTFAGFVRQVQACRKGQN